MVYTEKLSKFPNVFPIKSKEMDEIEPEKDTLSWDKWLPYILLAYRSRIHSSTKYTPFELMFGRKMNFFDDWIRMLSD